MLVQHPVLGQVYVIDELNLDMPFMISWTDDNPQSAVVRFRSTDGVKVELTAKVDPGHGELPIEGWEQSRARQFHGSSWH